jgi:hypothetical protein
MMQAQLKLRLNNVQEVRLVGWLWNLTSVWNWAIRKIELEAKDKIYYTPKDFQNLLANHGEKLKIPSHTLQGLLFAFTSKNYPRGKSSAVASFDVFPPRPVLTAGAPLVPQDGPGLR